MSIKLAESNRVMALAVVTQNIHTLKKIRNILKYLMHN